MSGPLAAKRALVTGASRGIGRATAEALAEAGARVAIHFRSRRQKAEELARSLPGGPHPILAADLGRPGAGRRLLAEAVDALGGLDVLVNNAGIYEEHPPGVTAAEAWDEAWKRTLQVNLFAVAELCHAAIGPLRQAGGGKIVNVSSRGAFRGEPTAPAYGAAKAGLNSLSQSLAVALAPEGIHVYVIAPGWVETDMAEPHLTGEGGEAIRAGIPLGRPATPEEVATAAVFFAGDNTASMTGAVLDVNGGSYLRT